MTTNEERLATNWANLKDTEPVLKQLIDAQSRPCFITCNNGVSSYNITWHGHPACLLIISNTGGPNGTDPAGRVKCR